MPSTPQRLGLALCIILVGLLSLPAIQTAWPVLPNGRALQGYVETKAVRPDDPARGWFDRSLQRWLDASTETDLGFRPLLVRTFDEVEFDLFRNLPRANELATSEHNLYHYFNIKGLNELVVHKANIEISYRNLAVQLRALQDALAARGKHFEVVIAASKPLVSLDDLPERYLAAPRDGIYGKTADVAGVLKENGVNVLDSIEMLRQVRARGIPTHATSGAHWNYYAGCLVARQILDNARRELGEGAPQLGCDPPQIGPPRFTDTDGLDLLNILTDGGLVSPTAFPTLTSVAQSSSLPRFLFVSDSYSEEIMHTLLASRAVRSIVYSKYYRQRLLMGPDGTTLADDGPETPEEIVRSKVFGDVVAADIIVLEMVDFTLETMGYGFAEHVLQQLADPHALLEAPPVQASR